MRVSDLLTKAGVRANVQAWTGNAINMNLMSSILSIFHQTLNQINNDSAMTFYQENHNWARLSDVQNPDRFKQPQAIFQVSARYPLPLDCRRVLRAFVGTITLAKIDYGELLHVRTIPRGLTNSFAINKNHIELVVPSLCEIVYAKEFKEYVPQEEIDIPKFAEDYVISLTAFNIACVHNPEAAIRCEQQATQARYFLMDNMANEIGDVYINQFETNVRFNSFGGMIPGGVM